MTDSGADLVAATTLARPCGLPGARTRRAAALASNHRAPADGLALRSKVLERLSDPTVRVAVITAPAGYGKTSHAAAWSPRDDGRSRGSTSRPGSDDALVLLVELVAALTDVTDLDDTVWTPPACATGAVPTGGRGRAGSRRSRLHGAVRARARRRAPVDRSRRPRSGRRTGLERPAGLDGGPRRTFVPTERPRAGCGSSRRSSRSASTTSRWRPMRSPPSWPTWAWTPPSTTWMPWPRRPRVGRSVSGSPASHRSPATSANRWHRRTSADAIRTSSDTSPANGLGDLTEDERDFLLRVSVLDWLTGPSCSGGVRPSDAGEVLHRLWSERLLLIPLDRRERRVPDARAAPDALVAELERSDLDELRRRPPAGEHVVRGGR